MWSLYFLRSRAAKNPRMPGNEPLPSSMKRCCSGVRSNQGTLVGMLAVFGGAEHFAVVGAVLGGDPGGDGAFGEGFGFVGDDKVGVEVDGVAEALAARAGSVGVVEREEAGFGLAVGAVAGGAFEGGGEAQVPGRAKNNSRSFDYGGKCAAFAQDDTFGGGVFGAGEGVELDFAGFAVAGLDGIYDSGAGVGANGEAVDEDEDGGGEV